MSVKRKTVLRFLFPIYRASGNTDDSHFAILYAGFTLSGTVKIIDFGLARMLENSDPKSNEVYAMSGETGSLRYMAPGKLSLYRCVCIL